MRALVSYHKGFVTFVKILPASWEGESLLKVEDRTYRLRELSLGEYLLSLALWTVPLLLVLYLYAIPYVLTGEVLRLLLVALPVLLFFLFALRPFPAVGVLLFLFPVFLLLKPGLLFDYVAGMVAGYAVYLLYLFGERGYKAESGEVIALWKM